MVEFDPTYGRNIGPERWIADTGCVDDLIGHNDMTPQDWVDVEPAPDALCLHSANGPVCANQMISYQCQTTGEVIDALIMKDSPPVLSIGRRCMQDGWSFVWEAYDAPYVILPSGKIITCIVEGNVPYLPHRPLPVAAVPRTTNQRAAPGCVRAPLPALAGGGDAPRER